LLQLLGHVVQPVSASAIDTNTIPSSTSTPFQWDVSDAIDILSSQRLACDNIVNVIQDGNLNEAAYKIIQLNSQTQIACKIILDNTFTSSFQTNNNNESRKLSLVARTGTHGNRPTSTNTKSMNNKMTQLLDVSDECEVEIKNVLRGKYGVSAPAQIKLLGSMKILIDAFDVVLMEVLEDERNTTGSL